MAFTSSIFSHIPLNNQRVYSPNFHKPKLPRATVTASLSPKSPPTSTEPPWPSSVAALPAATSLTDPERRRCLQSEEAGAGDKEVVAEYSKNSGFQRWRKIYAETGDVNREQMDIRHGHSKTVENVLKILKDEGSLEGVSVRGVGSSAIPLGKTGRLFMLVIFLRPWWVEAEKQMREWRRRLIVLLCFLFGWLI